MAKQQAKYLNGITPEAPQKFKHFSLGHDKPPGLYENNAHTIVFSFKYLNLNESALCYNNPKLASEDYHKLFERLKSIGDKTYHEMKHGGSYYRFHDVRFEDKNVTWTLNDFKKAIALNPDKVSDDSLPTCYQFDAFEEARVLGFLGYAGVFYPVWLDRNHKTYERN